MCRVIVENGYGDLIVLVDGERITSVKSILCCANTIFKSLIDDERFSGILELFEGCSKLGFLCLEKYYGGGRLEINEMNCVDILCICVYYNEMQLLQECKTYYYFLFINRYIKNNLTTNVMTKLLNNIDILKSNYLVELHDITSEYILHQSSQLLNESIFNLINIYR